MGHVKIAKAKCKLRQLAPLGKMREAQCFVFCVCVCFKDNIYYIVYGLKGGQF